MNPLKECRDQLIAINESILNAILQRREIVKKIADLKQTGLDPKRELEIFDSQLPFFKQLTPHECFVFSFLMETQANQLMSDYPRWSAGVHLMRGPVSFVEKTNPLLLKKVAPDFFATLPLKPEFEYLRQMS